MIKIILAFNFLCFLIKGFGNVFANTDGEKLFAIVAMLVGCNVSIIFLSKKIFIMII